LPDVDRDEEENRLREQLRQEISLSVLHVQLPNITWKLQSEFYKKKNLTGFFVLGMGGQTEITKRGDN